MGQIRDDRALRTDTPVFILDLFVVNFRSGNDDSLCDHKHYYIY